ncbi:hypothetical protein SSPS47_16000 [Streptomyces sp. S4.7]|nr:hypothetical protein SSPS47_16000 [Streptomyces sp. S4.7]
MPSAPRPQALQGGEPGEGLEIVEARTAAPIKADEPGELGERREVGEPGAAVQMECAQDRGEMPQALGDGLAHLEVGAVLARVGGGEELFGEAVGVGDLGPELQECVGARLPEGGETRGEREGPGWVDGRGVIRPDEEFLYGLTGPRGLGGGQQSTQRVEFARALGGGVRPGGGHGIAGQAPGRTAPARGVEAPDTGSGADLERPQPQLQRQDQPQLAALARQQRPLSP